MNCKQMESNVIAFLDGRLGRRKAAAVERHAAGCAECAERLRGIPQVSSLLDGWEPLTPSSSFDSRLQQRILAEPAAPAQWEDRLSLWLRVNPFGRPALAGALLGMLTLAVALTGYLPGTGVSIQRRAASSAVAATNPDDNDDAVLYQELAVLENLDLLRNFEVLQELQTTTP